MNETRMKWRSRKEYLHFNESSMQTLHTNTVLLNSSAFLSDVGKFNRLEPTVYGILRSNGENLSINVHLVEWIVFLLVFWRVTDSWKLSQKADILY